MKKLFTSESVTVGHPDKLSDQIADAILDSLLRQDPASRVAVEVMVTVGTCFVAGEITTSGYADILKIARQIIRESGYTKPEYGFHWQDIGAMTAIHGQSSDIAQGVNSQKLEDMGAGDQGLVFGYACRETPELMPLPIVLAHNLAKRLQYVREKNIIKGLRPDGKSQVTVEYEGDKVSKVVSAVIAAQHDPDKNLGKLKDEIIKKVIEPIITLKLRLKKPEYLINATGKFVVGGPQADTGATGRKNIVDTYGGAARHGGGSLSGKDPSKVDRSGQYAARWVAKNIVAAGLAEKCEVQIGYAIGTARPLSILVETFGTSSPRVKGGDEDIANTVSKIFDLRPGMIIKNLKLRRPIYRQLAAYGHFGREELNLTWERMDKVKQLLQALKPKNPK